MFGDLMKQEVGLTMESWEQEALEGPSPSALGIKGERRYRSGLW